MRFQPFTTTAVCSLLIGIGWARPVSTEDRWSLTAISPMKFRRTSLMHRLHLVTHDPKMRRSKHNPITA